MLRWPGRCLDRIVHLFRAHGVRSSCRKRDKILLLLDPSLLIRDTTTVLSVLTRRTDPCGGYSKRRDRVTARPSRVFMCRRLSSWDQTPLIVDPREDTPPPTLFSRRLSRPRGWEVGWTRELGLPGSVSGSTIGGVVGTAAMVAGIS